MEGIEYAELKAELDKLPAGSRRRYGRAISKKIEQYANEQVAGGAKRSHIANELGMCIGTLTRMLDIQSDKQAFRRVRVVNETTGGGRIRLPNGVVIEGLCLEELITLVIRLSD